MIGDEVPQKVRTRPCKALENMATSSPFILKIMGEPICIFYIPFHWLLVARAERGRDRRLSQTFRWRVTVVCCHMGLVRWSWGGVEAIAGRKCSLDHTIISEVKKRRWLGRPVVYLRVEVIGVNFIIIQSGEKVS